MVHAPNPDPRAVADALGLPVTINRFDVCPCCESEKTAQLYEEHFHCFHDKCGVRGTAIDLIAMYLGLVEPNGEGRFPLLDAEQMAKIRAWLAEHPVSAAIPKPKVEPSVLRSKRRAEVDIVWDAAGRVDEDAQVPGWLSGARKLDPKVLADLDLCRALPDEAERFDWCSWWKMGHRLLVPVYGPKGELGDGCGTLFCTVSQGVYSASDSLEPTTELKDSPVWAKNLRKLPGP